MTGLEGRITLSESQAQAQQLTDRLLSLCQPKIHKGNRRLARFLNEHADEVFNYLRRPNFDATNWRPEQAIRPAVVNRKVWGGSRTQNGAEAQGILASVLRTATQLGTQTFDFLASTLRAPPGKAPKLIHPPV